MKGNSSIANIEKILNEAQAILSEDPKQSISLAKKSYNLSQSESCFFGMVKSMIVLIKGNIYFGDMGAASQLCKGAFKIIEEKEEKDLEYKYEYAEIQLCLSFIYYYFGEFDLALQHIAANTHPENKSIDLLLKAKSLTLQGNVQSLQNNYTAAFDSFRKSLEIKQTMSRQGESIAKSLMSMATVYIHLNDLQKALKYTAEAGKHLGITQGHTKCVQLLNTGVILGKQGFLAEAIDKLETTLDICRSNSFHGLEAAALSNLGEFHYSSGDIDQSLYYAREGIALLGKHNFKNKSYMTCVLTSFRCHHAKDDLEKAAQIAKESIKRCKGTNYHDLAINFHQELVVVLEKMGNVNEALSISKGLSMLQASTFQKKRNFDISQVQSKLEIQMKEQELNMQRELIEQQEKHNKELLVINKELDRFVGIASHDLTEPIRNIKFFSKVLEQYVTKDTEEYEYLHYIQEASLRMTALVEDLLSFARAGKSVKPAELINLEDIVYYVEQNLRTSIESSNAQIIHEGLPQIIAHKTPILQLFQNIISNSIKYSRSDADPIIGIGTEILENKIIITIADNGLGIIPERLVTIFEPFTRIYRKSDKKGSGIGLATCKRIVERYKGEIWATSNLGKGTTIHISIPFS